MKEKVTPEYNIFDNNDDDDDDDDDCDDDDDDDDDVDLFSGFWSLEVYRLELLSYQTYLDKNTEQACIDFRY